MIIYSVLHKISFVFELVSIEVLYEPFSDTSGYPASKDKKHRLTQTLSLVPGRAWAGMARDGRINPLYTLEHASTAKSGAETPQRVSGMARVSYRLFDDSVLWWLRVDGRERRRRAVCTRKVNESFQHTACSRRSNDRTTIYSQRQQQTGPTAEAAARSGSGGASAGAASYERESLVLSG